MQKVNEMMAGGDDVGLSYIRGIDHFGMTRSPEAMESMKEFLKRVFTDTPSTNTP